MKTGMILALVAAASLLASMGSAQATTSTQQNQEQINLAWYPGSWCSMHPRACAARGYCANHPAQCAARAPVRGYCYYHPRAPRCR